MLLEFQLLWQQKHLLTIFTPWAKLRSYMACSDNQYLCSHVLLIAFMAPVMTSVGLGLGCLQLCYLRYFRLYCIYLSFHSKVQTHYPGLAVSHSLVWEGSKILTITSDFSSPWACVEQVDWSQACSPSRTVSFLCYCNVRVLLTTTSSGFLTASPTPNSPLKARTVM